MPMARIHNSVVNTMVLRLIASREIVAFAVFRSFLIVEMGGSLYKFVSTQVGAEW